MVHYQQGHLDQGQNMAYMGRQLDMDDNCNVYGFEHTAVKHPGEDDSCFKSKLQFYWRGNQQTPKIGWKPLSLSPPMLGLLATVSVLIASGIELLAQRSTLNGGLALSPTQDDIPDAAMFAYRYIPNIAAAIYSLVWNWVDLDVKRMQPWFELSKPDGSCAADSLLLEYPAEFIAFIPLKAARKRHWSTFLSGTIVLMVFWLLTPLQSAIVGTGSVTKTTSVTIGNRSQIIAVADQSNLMDAQLLNNGYAVGWFKQALPPFVAPAYAVLPYHVEQDSAASQATVKYTAITTKLSTKLRCWPAQVSRRSPDNNTRYDFLNGQGCNTTMDLNQYNQYNMYYVGYLSSPYSSWFLACPSCPPTPDVSHQFLAIWSNVTVNKGFASEFDVTALFCQSSYYKQQVSISVDSRNFKPLDDTIQPISKEEPLTESEFNSTAFEYLIATGMPAGAESQTRDTAFLGTIRQAPRVRRLGLQSPIDPMVGFALAGQNHTIGYYKDPSLLAQSFERAHQYLFSVAVSRLLIKHADFSNHTATSTYEVSGIIVSRVFSIVVESVLLFISLLCLILLWICYKCPSNLHSNPNSITRLAEICRQSPDILDTFGRLDFADGKSLFSTFKNDQFRLSSNQRNGETTLFIERVGQAELQSVKPAQERPSSYFRPIRPFPLTRKMGFIFMVILVCAIATIAYLKAKEASLGGLPRPSERFEVLQLLENYIPTAFSTLVEPFWVLLNRLLCVMQPFRDLSQGRALPSKSVNTTYTAIPPQLAIWRAFKGRHFLLLIVCITTLSANLLGIGLGALFNENKMRASYMDSVSPIWSDRITESFDAFNNVTRRGEASFFSDHLYYSLNVIQGTPFPPWTTAEFFFRPYNVSATSQSAVTDIFTVNTRGYGVNLNCVHMDTATLSVKPSLELSQLGNMTSCPDPIDLLTTLYRGDSDSGVPTGRAFAAEYVDIHLLDTGVPCGLLAWLRNYLPGQDISSFGNYTRPISASFAKCSPTLETAMFNVSVDGVGNVVSYNRTTTIESAPPHPNGEQASKQLMKIGSQNLMLGVTWGKDMIAPDWISQLVAIKTGSREFLDPTKPPPDPKKMAPIVDSVYRQTFSLLLALYQDMLFQPADTAESIRCIRDTTETRIFLDQSALIITLTVLSMNVFVVFLFYGKAITVCLPRMPTSIGSLFAYIAPSHAMSTLNYNKKSSQITTFTFGRYIGTDGKSHVGIEADPNVVAVHPPSLGRTSILSRQVPFLRKRPGRVQDETTWL